MKKYVIIHYVIDTDIQFTNFYEIDVRNTATRKKYYTENSITEEIYLTEDNCLIKTILHDASDGELSFQKQDNGSYKWKWSGISINYKFLSQGIEILEFNNNKEAVVWFKLR